MKNPAQFLACSIALVALSGCVSPPTWLNKGTGQLTTASGRIVCHTDASIIDGERMEGTLCASHESNFFGGGEPKIHFGPWGRKFMSGLASETTTGITADYQGKKVLLQCDPVLNSDSKEIGRTCRVTINDQPLVSANVT